MNRRLPRSLQACCCVLAVSACAMAEDEPRPGFARKLGIDIDVRSFSRITADLIRTANGITLPNAPGVPGGATVPQIHLKGGNSQVNDPAMDVFNAFPGYQALMNITQSETSIAVDGKTIVAGYNNSAGGKFVDSGQGYLALTQLFFSGVSVSNDGGATWKTGFVPPLPGSVYTLGDPSVGVDRAGRFYYAGLGLDKDFNTTIQVNRSTDGGRTWSEPALLQVDNGGDKEWLAVGPDPVQSNRDNVYVTWTSFQPQACELRFARSLDSGLTWQTSTIFVPVNDPDPRKPQSCLQFSSPVVDAKTGVLYVPFVQYSGSDADYIRVLVSKDAGTSFKLLKFNAPGALVPDGLPFVQAGAASECGAFLVAPNVLLPNVRLVIQSGGDIGGSLTGLPRYVFANRLLPQPAMAARNGVLYLAWPASTSASLGDPAGHSNVWFIRSDDSGSSWTAPVMVNPPSTDTHHVAASLAIDVDPNDIHILYYTQHANGSLDVDMANSHDRGATFPANRTVRVSSSSFNLPPSNVPTPWSLNPFETSNADRLIAQCYSLGEYTSITTNNGSVFSLWGDGRNTVTEPPFALLEGFTHAQMDVMFQATKAQ